jgi:hypothetical protein
LKLCLKLWGWGFGFSTPQLQRTIGKTSCSSWTRRTLEGEFDVDGRMNGPSFAGINSGGFSSLGTPVGACSYSLSQIYRGYPGNISSSCDNGACQHVKTWERMPCGALPSVLKWMQADSTAIVNTRHSLLDLLKACTI